MNPSPRERTIIMTIRGHLLSMLMLHASCTLAQQGYLVEYINFEHEYPDSINALLRRENTSNLGTLLVQGYVDGKLTGYKFSYKEETLRYAPLPPELWPPAWNPKSYYFLGDRVSYDGHGYEMMNEIRPSPIPPNESDTWWRYELRGQPMHMKYSFPTSRDTLSKAEFLKNMISQESVIRQNWNSDQFYYLDDLVEYEGDIYVAIKDCNPGTSPRDKTNWQLTYPFHIFHSLAELTSVRMLSHYKKVGSDTTWTPQTISLLVYDFNKGYAADEVVTFLYCDVVSYLDSIVQPILYRSETGYIENRAFVLESKSRKNLLDIVQATLTGKKLAQGDLTVKDRSKFMDFVNSSGESRKNFSISQDLITNDLRLHYLGKSVALIPVKKLLATFPIEKPAWFTYSGALHQRAFVSQTSNILQYRDSTVVLDLMTPFSACQPVSPNQYYWIEEYFVDYQNQQKQFLLKEAWTCIVMDTQWMNTQRKKKRTFYSLSFDWSRAYKDTVGLKLNNVNWHSLLNNDSEEDSPTALSDRNSIDFRGLSVIYKRYWSSGSDLKTRPIEITIYAQQGESVATDLFDWESVKDLWRRKDSHKYNALIRSIETGAIDVGGSALVEGLHALR